MDRKVTIIAALIGFAGAILAAIIVILPQLMSMRQPTDESATQLPAVQPTETVQSTQAPLPDLTFDVYDDFSSGSLGGAWGSVEGDFSPVIEDGALRLDYAASDEYGGGGVHVNNNRPLRLLATELVLDSAEPNSYVFVQVHLGTVDGNHWYANFGIMHTGELFYADAPVGEPPTDVEANWPSAGWGNPNTLIVEWVEDSVLFYGNGSLLTQVNAGDGGQWAIFSVGAGDGGSSTNEFRWAGWSYR